MKFLTLLMLLTSLTVSGQTISTGAMGSSVGALNQITKGTEEGIDGLGPQDEQEKLYQEQQQRERQEWEASKAQDQYKLKELEKSQQWKSQ